MDDQALRMEGYGSCEVARNQHFGASEFTPTYQVAMSLYPPTRLCGLD